MKFQNEKYRPQLHYTTPQNWLNDVNGLLYFEGEYHLFHNYNPHGREWSNIHWYHAVSKNLLHWEHLGIALSMKDHGRGGHIYSGSGVVDFQNTSGFGSKKHPPLVLIYTIHESGSEAETQNIAYSTDLGRKWVAYLDNPVIEAKYIDNQRDPKVFWYEPETKWIMVLFENGGIAFYSSLDLKSWSYLSRFNGESGFHECPDLFKLPLDSKVDDTRWVIHDAGLNGYMVGHFDGIQFIPESYEIHKLDYGKNFYAAQTFNNLPEDQRIQIAWMVGGEFPGMPFNQQMTFPCRLSLMRFPEGIRLCRNPIEVIDELRVPLLSFQDKILKPAEDPLANVMEDIFELIIEAESKGSQQFGFDLEDLVITYFFTDEILVLHHKNERYCDQLAKPLQPIHNKIKLQIIVDRTSIEIFGNNGRISISSCYLHKRRNKNLLAQIHFFSQGGDLLIRTFALNKMKSIWD